MSHPRKVNETHTELSNTVIKDDGEEKITETVTLVEKEYEDGSTSRDLYTDYEVEKTDGTTYNWHGSLHDSGDENLDLQTDSGTYHQHQKDEDGNYQKSRWDSNDD